MTEWSEENDKNHKWRVGKKTECQDQRIKNFDDENDHRDKNDKGNKSDSNDKSNRSDKADKNDKSD